MLFEMLTGQRPFVKERSEALMFAIISNAAPSVRSLRPDVPEALDRLIAECLRKDPAQRPALRGARQPGAARDPRRRTDFGAAALRDETSIRAIAVLPLRNVSRDPAQEYFADGMTESIISDLARVKALRVISRTSAMRYKEIAKSLPEIARELNVDAVLEGSALLVGNRVRLSVQLVSARTDETLWSERYDRDLEDVLGMQSELAETVARDDRDPAHSDRGDAARESRAGKRRGASRVPEEPHSFFGGSPEAMELALRHAKRALELDPTSALAWSVLADCHIFRAIRGMAPPAEATAAAMTAAKQGARNSTLPLADAHVSLGTILSHSGDLAGGLRALEKAVELNPGLGEAHILLGRALYAYERHDEAHAAMNKAVESRSRSR